MEMSPISHRMIADLLEERTGQQLTEARRWRIGSALSGIFRERDISNADQLVCLLARPDGSALAREVVEALLNNETYFFRDRAMFDLIDRVVIPDLMRRRADTRRLSIWSAGCSSGQEALSLAMLFETQPHRWADWDIRIIGTDISDRAIATAKNGVYKQFEVQRGLGVAQMLEFFDETPQGWTINSRLRRLIRYEVHNIFDPLPNPVDFDLILCRNVLLYFSPERRAQVFDRLASSIVRNGYLMLGAGETVVGHTEAFAPCRGHTGLYQPTH